MKKELKRYYLVEYFGERTKTVDSFEEVESIISEIKKYNNRKSSKFLFGNLKVEKNNEKYDLSAHIYRKFTERCTISELDDYTSKFDEEEIMKIYEDESKMQEGYLPDINIAYLETKDKDENGYVKYERGVKYLPVLYKDDVKYMNPKYIKECLYFHASIKDFDFFRALAEEFSPHHFVSDEISDLYTEIDKCSNQNKVTNSLYYAAEKLYTKFILEYERDESLSRDEKGKYVISRRRLRDFGFFVKNYDIRSSKIKSPLCYNMPLPENPYFEEESGQLKLKLK